MKSPKSYLVLAALAALALATAATGAESSEPSAGHAASYGEALTLETTTPIADIVADPRGFDGRRVRVTGEVEGVCPMQHKQTALPWHRAKQATCLKSHLYLCRL
jgi:hypothetical protein